MGLSAPAPPWRAPQLTLMGRAWVLYTQPEVVIPRYRLSVGTSEKIQLGSLIAAFQVTRDLIVAEA